jgi:hypothetical protein
MNAPILWRDVGARRFFLLPDEHVPAAGALTITNLLGVERSVDPNAVVPFEVNEEQAHRWARNELSEALGELKRGIDACFEDMRRELREQKRQPISEKSAVTAEAGPVLLDFLKALPRVIGQSLSGDPKRVDTARDTLAHLQKSLQDSGIDVDDRVGNFADRIASIRSEAFSQSKTPENKD